jgi:hypothetical protein
MKLTGLGLAIFALLALCGVPGAHAAGKLMYGCKTEDCVMARGMALMHEQTEAAQHERDEARKAAQAVMSARITGAPIMVAPTIPEPRRAILAYQLQDILTQASHRPVWVQSAEMFQYAEGPGFLFCGTAKYGDTDGGVFIVDTRDLTVANFKLHATKEEFGHAGCAAEGTVLR